jgi:hypothetical protein
VSSAGKAGRVKLSFHKVKAQKPKKESCSKNLIFSSDIERMSRAMCLPSFYPDSDVEKATRRRKKTKTFAQLNVAMIYGSLIKFMLHVLALCLSPTHLSCPVVLPHHVM